MYTIWQPRFEVEPEIPEDVGSDTFTKLLLENVFGRIERNGNVFVSNQN
jgi:hypothetical protein